MNGRSASHTLIPLVDLKAQCAAIVKDVERAIANMIDRCDFILGEELALFEQGQLAVAHAAQARSRQRIGGRPPMTSGSIW